MFINLTPHTISVQRIDGSMLEIPASGTIARCTVEQELVDHIDGVDLFRTTYGNVTNLPNEVAGTFYIVSMPVRLAQPWRLDLLSPGELIRNDQGQPVGCKGFACNL